MAEVDLKGVVVVVDLADLVAAEKVALVEEVFPTQVAHLYLKVEI